MPAGAADLGSQWAWWGGGAMVDHRSGSSGIGGSVVVGSIARQEPRVTSGTWSPGDEQQSEVGATDLAILVQVGNRIRRSPGHEQDGEIRTVHDPVLVEVALEEQLLGLVAELLDDPDAVLKAHNLLHPA